MCVCMCVYVCVCVCVCVSVCVDASPLSIYITYNDIQMGGAVVLT